MKSGPAKLLSDADIRRLLRVTRKSRNPTRNKAIVLLSVRAGLRASEIAMLEWSMITDGRGRIGPVFELPGRVTKYGLARRIPIHPDLKRALAELQLKTDGQGPVIVSERVNDSQGSPRPMTAKSIVNWFMLTCEEAGLEGCSSHSGRRTFVTRAARLIPKAGGSLRDVQQLAGHRSIETTQAYIDGDREIQRRLVRMM